MSAARTPGPWTLEGRSIITDGHQHSDRNSEIATVSGPREFGTTSAPGELEANAAFIVLACNAHDELVAALEAVTDRLGVVLECDADDSRQECAEDIAAYALARAALAKVQSGGGGV